MNASKHTPGPWVAVARTNAHIEIEAPNQLGYLAKKVASCSLTNHEANARLIAAAPELLVALEVLVREYEPNIKTFVDNAPRKAKWMAAIDAIAKATGETSK